MSAEELTPEQPYWWWPAGDDWYQVHASSGSMASYTYYKASDIQSMAKRDPRMSATLRDIRGNGEYRRADNYYCDAF